MCMSWIEQESVGRVYIYTYTYIQKERSLALEKSKHNSQLTHTVRNLLVIIFPNHIHVHFVSSKTVISIFYRHLRSFERLNKYLNETKGTTAMPRNSYHIKLQQKHQEQRLGVIMGKEFSFQKS